MKKILVTAVVAALLSVTSAMPALADEWGGRHGEISILNPLWPVAVALSIPAAIVGTVARATIPPPVVYSAPPEPVVYERPVTYYQPYQPRAYVAPRGYYYSGRGYYYPRAYRRCW